MEALIEFIKILVPASLVLYAMFLVVKAFLNKEIVKASMQFKANNSKEVIPIRLQAYERIILFLERISPNNLVMRLNQPQMTAKELQQLMLLDVRDEYNHNVSQQVYMSDESWDLVKNAKEDLIVTINNASENLDKNSSSMDLAKAIFQEAMQKEVDPITLAIQEVKDEIRRSF